MKHIINSFPAQHRWLLITALIMVFALLLWPAEKATAQKTTTSLVVTDYQQLELGKEYPLPLDFTEQEQELAQTFSETRQVKIKKGDTLADIFKRVGLSQKTMLEVVRSGKAAKNFTKKSFRVNIWYSKPTRKTSCCRLVMSLTLCRP